jgi:hypothetical protein
LKEFRSSWWELEFFLILFCTFIYVARNRQTTGLLASGSQYRNGTCMTAPECSQKGGSESGTCAGGYEINSSIVKLQLIINNLI